MIEGLLRHLTSAEIDRQYTDTHGASIVGFAFSHLLDFKLLPRLKNIGSARLYRPGLTEGEAWPELDGVLSGKTITGERYLFGACGIPWIPGRSAPSIPASRGVKHRVYGSVNVGRVHSGERVAQVDGDAVG